MAAFLGISLWIALVTVVPGLITIAVIYGAFAIVNPSLVSTDSSIIGTNSSWIGSAFAITIMVLTQVLGILLEELLVAKRWLGGKSKKSNCKKTKCTKVMTFNIPEGITPSHKTSVEVDPYEEYQGLYFLLATLTESEDSQGHLKRAVAQFFLTNNTLVSFSAGIITALVLALTGDNISWKNSMLYVIGLIACLAVSYVVTVIRFREMIKSLWATRYIRTKEIARY